MSAFTIDGIGPFELEIPNGKDSTVTVILYPVDALPVQNVEPVEKILTEYAETPAEAVRQVLLYFNKQANKQAAIKKLVVRQLRQIDRIWGEQSGMTMGELSPSTEPSSMEGTPEQTPSEPTS